MRVFSTSSRSARLAIAMAGSAPLLIAKVCLTTLLLQHFGAPSMMLASTHYTDDSDYDFDYYQLPEKPMQSDQMQQDDFYMVGPEEVEDRSRRVVSSQEDADNPPVSISSNERLKEDVKGEKIYRYTKHRIPGYDYEELEYLESSRRIERCDERSVWTHCLCQFTCAQPNIVDCYTPCDSGCECREDYVYDERTEECVPPEQCQPDADYLLY